MEINKEREAFEIKFKSSDRSALDYLKYHNITNKYVISNDIDRYQMSEAQDCAHIVNVAWHMWQAAKATPEGFVLVPKVLPSEINDQVWDDYLTPQCVVNEDGFSFISCEDFDLDALYQTLLKAQEQSHD